MDDTLTIPSIHVLVINLKRRTDRWKALNDHINEMKARHKLSFITSLHRIEGIDNPEHPGKGCMQSHANTIKLAKAQHWNNVMVVEDDVRFPHNVDEIVSGVMQESIATRWKVIFGASLRVNQREVGMLSPHLVFLKSRGILTGTHCMIYNSLAYDEIISIIDNELTSTHPYHIDMLLCDKLNVAKSNVLLAVPFIGHFTPNDKSDVRVGKDTSNDYQQLVQTEHVACIIAKNVK